MAAPYAAKCFTHAATESGFDKIVLLVALDPGARHRRTQVGVFAVRLDDAAPARIARDIDHRREDPCDAIGTRFFRGYVAPRFRRLRDPSLRQWPAAPEMWCDGRESHRVRREWECATATSPSRCADSDWSCSAPTTFSIEPTWPLATSSSYVSFEAEGPVANPAEYCTVCPIFSSSVIFFSSASTRALSSFEASWGFGVERVWLGAAIAPKTASGRRKTAGSKCSVSQFRHDRK